MRCHNMECVNMRRKGSQFLALEVPGLAERRPSLVNGDHVFVKLENAPDSNAYQVCSYFGRKIYLIEVCIHAK